MPIPLSGKRIDQARLQAEMIAAGIDVGRGLLVRGTENARELTRYSPDGNEVLDLAPGAGAVLAAHVSPTPSPPADYGSDAADLDQQAAQAAAQLRAFIATGSPTNAEVVAQVRLQARVILALMRRGGL